MEVFVYDAVRSPRGKGRPDGALAGVTPPFLVSQLIDALRKRCDAQAINAAQSLILGCVTQVGAQGGHIAMASRLVSGLPNTTAPLTVNNYCVSGLTSIAAAHRRITIGEIDLALAGGVECMSQVGFMTDDASFYTDMTLAERMGWAPVGVGADALAAAEGIKRADLDRFALRSNRLAAMAWAEGRYEKRVIPIRDQQGNTALATDENIRDHGDGAKLADLPPVFEKPGAAGFDRIISAQRPELGAIEHVHTIAHCPPIADGAGLILLGSREAGERWNLSPVAKIVALAETSSDHVLQLTAGFSAMELALKRANATLADMDAIEFMEAFAVTPVKFERDYEPDMDKVNIHGGHLAMGHPMGATGAILFGALLDALDRLDGARGVVATTGGVGVGAAAVIERV
ncbi:MAG: acetyl-CoA C-acyltransferase [Amphiplicatus sp.]